MPIFCSLLQRPFLLPLISLSFFFLSTQKSQRVGQMLPGFSPSHETAHRRWHHRSQGRESVYRSNVRMTTVVNQSGLGGANCRSMGVTDHMQPHRVTDVKHHRGSHVSVRQIEIHARRSSDYQAATRQSCQVTRKLKNWIILFKLAALHFDCSCHKSTKDAAI